MMFVYSFQDAVGLVAIVTTLVVGLPVALFVDYLKKKRVDK
jgi:hypothetical protein